MSDEMKQLEKKIILRYFEDGFWDIYLGLLLFSFGCTILFDMGYLAGIFASLGILIPRYGKSKYTYPRIGYIKPRKSRKKNISFISLGVFVLGIVFFFFMMGGQENQVTQILKDNILFIIATIWGGALVAVSLILDVPRYAFFGVIVFGAVASAEWIGSLGINLTVSGIFFVIYGTVLFTRFVKHYPLAETDESAL